MYVRVRYKLLGGNIHCRLFVGKDEDHLQHSGEFTLREDELYEFASLSQFNWVQERPDIIDQPLSPPRAVPKPSALKKTRGRKKEEDVI